jgi:Putative MetA-pathway of phenol degradation
MKRIILIAALALPAWMAAQEKPADPRAAPAPGQPAKKQPSPSKTDKTKNARLDEEALMPNLSRSPTGYVEDAAVGTQVRFRFDAGFGMTAPDRAEFFYGKCGCYRSLGSPPKDANAPGPDSPTFKPVIVTKLRFQEAHVNFEYGFTRRFSLFADAAARSIQPQSSISPLTTIIIPNPFDTQTGAGDFQAGFKFALLASREGYLTLQLRTYFPTGDASSGLGTSHYAIEPTVLFTRKVAPDTTLSGQFGVWHPIQGSNASGASADTTQSFAGNVLEYGFGAGHRFLLAENLRVTPVVELVGWSVRSGYVTLISGPASASGNNIVNAKLGARIFVERHNSIYVGVGRQLSHVGWYRDFLRVEYARVF